jgi:predicted nucleic acid-binding protein
VARTLAPSDYLIDTGAVDLFVNPGEESILKFWKSLGKVQHAVCEVVCWEYLRQFEPTGNSKGRQRFRKAFEKGLVTSLPMDKHATKCAVALYQQVRKTLKDQEKQKRRLRMNELQCDVLIAAVAVRHGKAVITDDRTDWVMLSEAVKCCKIGTLPLLFKEDMRDPKKWRQ